MSSSELNPEFEALLNYIRRSRGLDFTGYKRSTLMRRVSKRMQDNSIENYSDYVDYLEVHPQEFLHLFNTLLINVTSFFRDRSTWEYLETEIITQIAARKQGNEPIRIWSAGCASGEEAYTLAISLAKALGIEKFRQQVKIYATDLDEEALNQARQGIYSAKEVKDIPADLLAEYFNVAEDCYTFRKDLRRSIIFGRHNLVQDAPISRIDLLVCRNTLMYFNTEAQARIISRFHFALNQGGFLFLGKAEMLLSHSNSFTPTDLKRRIFAKVPINTRPNLLLINGQSDNENSNYLTSNSLLREAAFDVCPVAQIVVETTGILTLANEQARSLIGLLSRDLGRSFSDLEISYRPVELRSCIDQVYNDQRIITLRDIEWKSSSENFQYFDIQITPLFDSNTNLLGVNITFIDVTRSKRLAEEVEHANQELEMAYEELQSTNEELETMNEELQSSNEELETTNEELQSTNEELETMNEELQSSNEELQTINDELRQRSNEFNEVNAFLESILTSLHRGVAVLDQGLYIQIWNREAEDLWGLRAAEAQGRHFLNLDIGLPVEQLRQHLRACIAGECEYVQVTLAAINSRGEQIQCLVTCTPLINANSQIQGAIMLMEEQPTATDAPA